MNDAQTGHDLTALARSGALADRGRLVLAIADMCAQSASKVRKPEVQTRLEPIFLTLATDAEHRIRVKLALKLAVADWAPPALVNMLARDDIEIARPIIAASPILSDADLCRLLTQTSIDHCVEIARRPYIGAAVADAILDQAEPDVMTALAGNDTADIQPGGMRRLVNEARHIAGLRSPLARHPRLTIDLAQTLYECVGGVLRAAIVSRFRIDVAALDAAIAEAVRDAHAQSQGVDENGPPPADDEHRQMERRLIAKLHAAGQLRVSYLLRALREQRLSLFEAGLAALGAYKPEAVQLAVNAESPEMLALACAGIDMDRIVFGDVLALVRQLNDGRPGGDAARARKAFDALQGDLAQRAFHESAASSSPRA